MISRTAVQIDADVHRGLDGSRTFVSKQKKSTCAWRIEWFITFNCTGSGHQTAFLTSTDAFVGCCSFSRCHHVLSWNCESSSDAEPQNDISCELEQCGVGKGDETQEPSFSWKDIEVKERLSGFLSCCHRYNKLIQICISTGFRAWSKKL